ncbi:MAG: glycosyltransferase [Candidatus Hadarchaeota archaeon]|nr:glycosyltransferase [Candidatus Hadarchaeota archaeon]
MSRRLKVLFIPAWYPSEDNPVNGLFVREHAKAVSLYDDVVVLYCQLARAQIKGLYELSEAMEEGIRTIRVRYRRSPIPKTTYFIYLWSVIGAFRKLVKEGFKPDVIHAHVFTAGVPAVILGKLFHIPVVITEQFTGFPRRILSWLDVMKAKFAMERADLILPVSDDLRKQIEGYGIHGRFQIVPNVVNTDQFYPSPSGRGRNSKRKRLLVVALLSPKKGVPYLLRALHKLQGKRGDFRLDIVGDGPNRTEYEQMVAELGLSDRVKFHGLKSKPEVAEFMRRCDFFVLPSLFETFGAVLVEALACGKPVIATNIGGPNEIVTEEVGRLVPPKDADALTEAIDCMLDRYDMYSSDEIAAYAKRRFSYEAVGRQLDEVYRWVV